MARSRVLVALATIAVISHAVTAANLTLVKRNHSAHFDAYPFGATIVEGTRVTLICNATAGVTPTPTIDWYVRSIGGTSTGVNIIRMPSLRSNVSFTSESLTILSFSKSFESEYDCSYRDPTQSTPVIRAGGFFTLYLAVAPEITRFTLPNVNVSGTTILTCSAENARPIPDYIEIWRGSARIARNESSYTVAHSLTNARTSDAGDYRCVAENIAGKRDGINALIVQTVPGVFSPNATTVYAPRGTSNALVCEARGTPTPIVRWFKNGASFRVGSPLNFSNLQAADTAKYTCEGRNDAGFKTYEINLFVQVPPDAPSIEGATKMENVSVTLSWKLSLDGYSPIVAYEVQYKLPNGSAWMTSLNLTEKRAEMSHTVLGLNPYEFYDFRVRAQNIIGTGPYSAPSTIRTHPNAPGISPRNLLNGTVDLQTAVLNWDLPVGNLAPNQAFIINYEVVYRTAGGSESSRFTDSNTNTTLTLTDLAKGTTYTVTVYARNSGPYRSPPSNSITIVTGTSVPGVPANIGTELTAISILLTWDLPADTGGLPILSYDIEYGLDSDSFTPESSTATNSTSFTITGLFPARDYVVRIRAVNERGASEWVTKNVRTKSSTTIDTLTPESVLRNGETQIDLDLKDFASYDISYARSGPRSATDSPPPPPGPAWKSETITPKNGIVRLTGLTPASIYYISVRPNGYTNYSEPLKTYTEYFLEVLKLIAKPKSFKIGETVLLTCQSLEGDILDAVTFYFKDNQLPKQNDLPVYQWRIQRATERDDGKYKCEDGEGHVGETTVQLAGKYETDRSKNAPIAGGITVAVIVFLCILIALIWYCKSRSNKKQKDEEEGQTIISSKKKDTVSVPAENVPDAPPPVIELKEKRRPSPPPYSRDPPPGATTVSSVTANPGYGTVARRDSGRISESPPLSPRREISPPRETAV